MAEKKPRMRSRFGTPGRRAEAVDKDPDVDPLAPEADRRLVDGRRRLQASSEWSMRMALILFVVLVFLLLLGWFLGGNG